MWRRTQDIPVSVDRLLIRAKSPTSSSSFPLGSISSAWAPVHTGSCSWVQTSDPLLAGLDFGLPRRLKRVPQLLLVRRPFLFEQLDEGTLFLLPLLLHLLRRLIVNSPSVSDDDRGRVDLASFVNRANDGTDEGGSAPSAPSTETAIDLALIQ